MGDDDAAGLEVIHAFRRFEDIGTLSRPATVRSAILRRKAFSLELGLFDGVHVGAVRWQISQFGSGRLYELLGPGSFVARQIVHDDDVAFREDGHKTFFHPFLERGRVDRAVEGLLRHEAAKAQAGDERNRLVVAVRTAARNLRPRRRRARLRAMFVETQVSSMNTRRAKARRTRNAHRNWRSGVPAFPAASCPAGGEAHRDYLLGLILGGDAELDDEIAGQVLRFGLGPLFLPEPD